MRRLLRTKKLYKPKNNKKRLSTVQRAGALKFLNQGSFGCAFGDYKNPGDPNEKPSIILKIQNCKDEKDLIFEEININDYLKKQLESIPELRNHICAFIKSYSINNPQESSQKSHSKSERRPFALKQADASSSVSNSNSTRLSSLPNVASNIVSKIEDNHSLMIQECRIGENFTKSDKYIIIEIPYCGISLYDFIQSKILKKPKQKTGMIDGKLALLLIEKIIESLSKLHKLGIMHGDINAGNILVDDSECSVDDFSKLRVRFIDFGYSVNMNTTSYEDFIETFNFHPVLPPEYLLFTAELSEKYNRKGLAKIITYAINNNIPNFPYYLYYEMTQHQTDIEEYRKNPKNLGEYGRTFLAYLNASLKKSNNPFSNIPKNSYLYSAFPVYEGKDNPKNFYNENNHANMYKRDYFQLGKMLFDLFISTTETLGIPASFTPIITGSVEEEIQTLIHLIYFLTMIDYEYRDNKISENESESES